MGNEIYRWFAAWRNDARITHALVTADRERVGRDASPSAAIIVKTTEAGGSSSPHAPSSTQHLSCCSCVGSLVLHDFRDRLLD
jgi:hypothetical protein